MTGAKRLSDLIETCSTVSVKNVKLTFPQRWQPWPAKPTAEELQEIEFVLDEVEPDE
jgi:hypothetical protein